MGNRHPCGAHVISSNRRAPKGKLKVARERTERTLSRNIDLRWHEQYQKLTTTAGPVSTQTDRHVGWWLDDVIDQASGSQCPWQNVHEQVNGHRVANAFPELGLLHPIGSPVPTIGWDALQSAHLIGGHEPVLNRDPVAAHLAPPSSQAGRAPLHC